MNPPCYNCESTTPLLAGQTGLCPACSTKVSERSTRTSSEGYCAKCGKVFYNDWERIQHVVNQRHNYSSWTEEDAKRYAAEKARA